MINHTFILTEEQLAWMQRKAAESNGTTSTILRRVLREAMEREGVNPAFMNITASNMPAKSDQN